MQPMLGKRARQACIACNARRVRCNVTETIPCRNCLADGSRCEVRESRRGKHPRRRASDQVAGAASGNKGTRPPPTINEARPQHSQSNQIDRHERRHGGVDEVAASEALVTLLQNNNQTPATIHDDTCTLGAAYPVPTGRHSDSTEPADTVKSVSPTSVSQHATGNSGADSTQDAEADPESSAVFIGSVFLGESTTLRYVHSDAADGDAEQPDDNSPGSTVHLLHQVPEPEIDNTLDTVDGSSGNAAGHGHGSANNKARPAWVVERRRIKMQFLQASGAFTYPPATTVDSLLDAYFMWFHPCFAIVDEAEARQRYRAGTLSPLLLQAMLFIGAVHGGDRQQAVTSGSEDASPSSKYIYYNRCKDLYDADYECDKVTIIQAVFLMSFWRTGPFLEKDTRHWLATAISLAQSKAMHRSATRVGTRVGRTSNASSTSPSGGATQSTDVTKKRDAARRLKQLKQRLWWSIYTREQQCAAALGLPSRISDEDCDVAPLQAQDFEFAFASKDGQKGQDGVTFQVGATGLARILGKIIRHGYAPGRTLTVECKKTLRQELRAWKPAAIDTCASHLGDDDDSSTSTFYTRLLHLTYNNLLILIYRPAYINNGKDHKDPRVDEEGRIALEAAAQNSRIVEDLVASPTLLSSLRHAPVHVITNLFNTLCMHTIHLRRLAHGIRGGDDASDDKKAKKEDNNVAALTIAEHRAKVCLLGLQELQRTWDVRNWILQLFFQYLDRATAARLAVDNKSLINGAKTVNNTMKMDTNTPREIPGQLALPAPPLPVATSLATDQPPPWVITGVDGGEYVDPASAETVDMLFSSPWTNVPTLEEQQIYLFSQMETDNLALGEGGGLCGYWGPSDPNIGLGQAGVVDNMTDFLGRM
ncbi:hypothetical protein SEUCBS140593_009739 [Sporothrix eucalyptigena]|uniref:Zn(2)-C6 fungal-type domain-containing protein n=1 Tax=Sporothrix eucalyptigena TaxID=1812306 RepID=A0ABP0CYB0_9PEZI